MKTEKTEIELLRQQVEKLQEENLGLRIKLGRVRDQRDDYKKDIKDLKEEIRYIRGTFSFAV